MKEPNILPKLNEYGCYEIRMESIGGQGANVAGKMLAQAGIISMGLNGANFSQYGSEKMGSPVKGYVRFTEEEMLRINSPIMKPHLLALFSTTLAKTLPVLEGLEKGNTIVVNTDKSSQEVRDELKIPGAVTLYCVDGTKIAMEEKVRLNTTMMGAMAKASGFLEPEAIKEFIKKAFEKKYPQLVEGNLKALDRGYNEAKMWEIPADDKYLTMPTGTRDIYTFRLVLGNGESRKLSRKTVTFFDRIIPDPAYVSVNKPQMYTLFNDKAELWPVPDAAYDYEIRRCAWPLAFTGEGDLTQKSDLDEKDDMITALSISWAMQSIGRSDDAARWWIIYTNMLNSAIGEDVEKPDQVIAPDFELGAQAPREYWKDPWVDGR